MLRERAGQRTAGTGTRSRCGSRASACGAAATAWPPSAARTLLSLLQAAGRRGRRGHAVRDAPSRATAAAGYDLVIAADGGQLGDPRELCRGRVWTLGRRRDGQVHLVRHELPVRRADLRPRARPARRLRGARLPDRAGGATFIVETDEPILARAQAWTPSTSRQPPGPERPGDQGVPGETVRRADRRLPAAGEQLPLGQLPHPPHRALAAPTGPPGRPARRRRAHRPLLRRLGHQDGDGGRHRPRRRARPARRRVPAGPGRVDAALAAYEAAARPSVSRSRTPRGRVAVVVGALRPSTTTPSSPGSSPTTSFAGSITDADWPAAHRTSCGGPRKWANGARRCGGAAAHPDRHAGWRQPGRVDPGRARRR